MIVYSCPRGDAKIHSQSLVGMLKKLCFTPPNLSSSLDANPKSESTTSLSKFVMIYIFRRSLFIHFSKSLKSFSFSFYFYHFLETYQESSSRC